MLTRATWYLGLAMLLTHSSIAWGGLVLSFGNVTPAPSLVGDTGTVDVFVETDSGTQLVDGFQVQISVTPAGASPAGGLKFSNVQQDAQLNVGGPNGYLFAGNSLSQATSVAVGTVTGGGSTYTGFDATNDFVPVSVTTTQRLLYRLNVIAFASGTYNLTVNSLASPSFFSDQLDPIASGVSFTSNPGSITLNVTAVPEPASVLLVTCALATAGARMRFGRVIRRACFA